MSKVKYYIQCRLKKIIDKDTYRLDDAWIPEKCAVLNKTIKIKKDGVWEDGWEVIEVGFKMNAKYVEDKERDYLKQRKASDI